MAKDKTAKQITMEDLLGLAGEDIVQLNSIDDCIKEVSKKYNKYDSLSALHKEIRRGDPENAFYWALMVTQGGSKWFALKYLFTIVLEETPCPELKEYVGNAFLNYKKLDYHGLCKTVYAFCKYPRPKYTLDISDYVWELDSHYWEEAKKDSKKGIRKYTPNQELVDKWKNKVDEEYHTISNKVYWNYEILALLEEGIKDKDMEKVFYMIPMMEDIHKIFYPYLGDLIGDNERANVLYRLHSNKMLKQYMWGFDMEAICLQLMGYGDEIPSEINDGSDSEIQSIIDKVFSEIKELKSRPVPLYAYDSHTRKGKSLWYKHRKDLKIGEPSEFMDLRYGANWVSLLWRRNAYLQYGTIHVNWEDVKMGKDAFNIALWKGRYVRDI